MSWGRFIRSMLTAFLLTLGVCTLFVVVMNPYGNLPRLMFADHIIMDSHQRFQYPSIARAGAFDGVIIGTSSSRLLDPDVLGRRLGGRFANLSMNDARAWEQYQLLKLYLQHTTMVKTVIVGLDSVWCDADADKNRITRRGFPEWMYDENSINDWQHLLNFKSVEIAVRQVQARFGSKPVDFPPNGFKVFVPPEAEYDLQRAQQHIWGGAGPREIASITPAVELTSNQQAALSFPALAWLDEVVASAAGKARVVLVFVPAHVTAMPVPGSVNAATFNACKQRVLDIARKRGADVVDYRFPSSLTRADTNFWDPLHYRVPIATRFAEGLADALLLAPDQDADVTWRRLHRARP